LLLFRQRDAELAKSKAEEEEPKTIARSFRYMRRKPTIISYKPPEGDFV
jgi:hypothetical protein